MGVNSLPKTVARQRRDCDLNPGPSAPESSTLTTRLPSHPFTYTTRLLFYCLGHFKNVYDDDDRRFAVCVRRASDSSKL